MSGDSPGSSRHQPADDDTLSVLSLVSPLVRRWQLMVAVPFAAVSVAVVYSLVTRPVWVASTTFTPDASAAGALPGGLASLAGLAGQFGINVPTGGSASPDFFAAVLRSRELLEATLRSEFPDPERPGAVRPLIEIMRVRAADDTLRLREGVRRLAELSATAIDRRTAVVSLTVRQNDRHLAASVANRMVQLLNTFNLQQRQSQSREQKRFAGERLREAAGELQQAEAALLRFLQTNRTYRGSPLLEFEASRLERDVQLKQQVQLSLTRAYEEARIAEVRDTPVLTIIDHAVPAARRAWPRRRVIVLLAFAAGLLAAALTVYVVEFRAAVAQSGRSDYEELRTAVASARRQIGAIVRRG